jgi:hypothetical protein
MFLKIEKVNDLIFFQFNYVSRFEIPSINQVLTKEDESNFYLCYSAYLGCVYARSYVNCLEQTVLHLRDALCLALVAIQCIC